MATKTETLKPKAENNTSVVTGKTASSGGREKGKQKPKDPRNPPKAVSPFTLI